MTSMAAACMELQIAGAATTHTTTATTTTTTTSSRSRSGSSSIRSRSSSSSSAGGSSGTGGGSYGGGFARARRVNVVVALPPSSSPAAAAGNLPLRLPLPVESLKVRGGGCYSGVLPQWRTSSPSSKMQEQAQGQAQQGKLKRASPWKLKQQSLATLKQGCQRKLKQRGGGAGGGSPSPQQLEQQQQQRQGSRGRAKGMLINPWREMLAAGGLGGLMTTTGDDDGEGESGEITLAAASGTSRRARASSTLARASTRDGGGGEISPGGGQSRSQSQRRTGGLRPETLFSKLPGLEVEAQHFSGEEKISKVTVVGVGNVGMACAQTILTQNLADEIALVDVVPDKLRGEMLDLQHAAAFLPNVTVMADTDYAVTAGSDVCIITAGARQREGEDRLSLVERNVSILKGIVPLLVKYSPDAILLVISNPVDVLTWATWKISGFPPSRVIGSGTTLDSSRFRALIANTFQVNAQSVHAQILGEHGDTSVPLWESVQVAGVPMAAFLRSKGMVSDPEELRLAHKTVVDGAYEVIRLKGYTSWAIGYAVAQLLASLLRNQRRVYPVSVLATGFHGIEDEVYLSLPASLGRAGVLGVANSVLSSEERQKLQESASGLVHVQQRIKL